MVIAKRGKKGKTAILGVKAPASLGKVQVRSGYAKLRRPLPRTKIDRKRKAKAKRGVPRGAGNFGRVRSGASGPAGPGTDQDRDGIPGALDIDDDGDLVLDDNDLLPGPGRGPAPPSEILDLGNQLSLPIEQTANASTPGSTDAQIESALPLSRDHVHRGAARRLARARLRG